jgi:hypothetical protein
MLSRVKPKASYCEGDLRGLIKVFYSRLDAHILSVISYCRYFGAVIAVLQLTNAVYYIKMTSFV